VTGVAVAGALLPLTGAGAHASAGPRDPRALQGEFTDAADHYRVPRRLLLAVSYLESRWDGHHGAPSVSGGYGPMHLTDARAALAHSARTGAAGGEARAAADGRGTGGSADHRADRSGGRAAAPSAHSAVPDRDAVPPRLRTLERAAQLTGLSKKRLRTDPGANIRGGAALLAAAQRRLGHRLGADPADWYAAVAAFPSGSGKAVKSAENAENADKAASGRTSGEAFADDVYDVLRTGAHRTTDAGQRVALPASPSVRPANAQVHALRSARQRTDSARSGAGSAPECPATVSCSWVRAPYKRYKDDDGKMQYGNHDVAKRPRSQSVDYIVVHDTEETWDKSLKLVQDPKYVSWNYTLRSADGRIAQHVPTKDVAWHAGNWYANSKSVGIEHEGYLTEPDAWFTEEMYRTSARLVRYLAHKYDIPLDRRHILGHDNVPGMTTDAIKGMHTDPGPYFDWDHYFALLGKPVVPHAGPGSKLVTIDPYYGTNRPRYTGCDAKHKDKPCAPHGSDAVRLHTAPDSKSPLVKDVGLHPKGGDSTVDVNDTGARASTGQQFAVAERKGDWTAVWYLGQEAWFHNPQDAPTAVPADGRLVTPRRGESEIPVYGRAYPEKSAYPKGIEVQKLSPLPYTVRAGQAYAAGSKVRGEYLSATDYDPDGKKFTVVRGKLRYYEIQIGHRIGYVRADDVRVTGSGS